MSDQFKPQMENENENARPEAELNAAVSRLSASSGENARDDMQHRLSIVDHLLMTAPLVLPSVEFAERVIEAIRRHRDDSFNRYSAVGVMLGLGTAMAAIIALVLLFALLVANIIINWTDVFQTLLLGIGSGISEISTLASDWNTLSAESPLVIALSVLSVPLFGVWMWIMRRLNNAEVRA